MANVNRTEGPVLIERDRIEAALQAISDINLGAAATYGLARAADASRRAEHYTTAIENIAKVTCRKCDLILDLLGEDGDLGNFAEDFNAKDALAEIARVREEHAAGDSA